MTIAEETPIYWQLSVENPDVWPSYWEAFDELRGVLALWSSCVVHKKKRKKGRYPSA